MSVPWANEIPEFILEPLGLFPARARYSAKRTPHEDCDATNKTTDQHSAQGCLSRLGDNREVQVHEAVEIAHRSSH